LWLNQAFIETMPNDYHSLYRAVQKRLLREKNNPHIARTPLQDPVVIGDKNVINFTNPSTWCAPKACNSSSGMVRWSIG
jgi:hypothetical protein